MKWSLQVARVFGIPVRVHITFLLLLLAVAFLGKRRDIEDQYYGMAMVCLVFVCVLVHELAHSLMARRFGVRVEGITLLPIGGVSQMRVMPREPWQEIVVAIIGPVTSLALAAAFLLFYTASGAKPVTLSRLDLFSGDLFLNLFTINLMLAVFNLIPAFPLDGGRVLRGVLSLMVGRERGTHAAVAIGEFFAIVLFFYGVFATWWLAMIAMFIYMGASGEGAQFDLLLDLSHGRARDAMLTNPLTLGPQTTLDEALAAFRHSAQEDFPVVEAGQIVGVLSRQALVAAARGRPRNAIVAELMDKGVAMAPEEASLEDVYEKMQEENDRVVTVVRDGQLAGMINLDQISKYEQLTRHGE